MPVNIYSTVQLLQTIESLHRAPRFLLDTFFPTVLTSDREEIAFDVEPDNLVLAPFVSPYVPGVAESEDAIETLFFKPGYLKPKNKVDPSKPLKRRAGEAIGGVLTAGERRDLAIQDLLLSQREKIDRREEWMAAQIITKGYVIVEGENYPRKKVDFRRKNTFTDELTGSNRWGQDGVKPYALLEDWMDELSTEVGAGVNVCIMGKDAWKFLKADSDFKDAIDREKGQTNTAELGFQTGMPGTGQFKGRIGDVEFWTYNGIYKDGNQIKKMIDDDGVILAATGAAAGTRHYGAIMDGSSGYQPYQYYPKNWVENDPGFEFVMTQSAPLPVLGRPNATRYTRVNKT